jgi:hypothetical protein
MDELECIVVREALRPASRVIQGMPSPSTTSWESLCYIFLIEVPWQAHQHFYPAYGSNAPVIYPITLNLNEFIVT